MKTKFALGLMVPVAAGGMMMFAGCVNESEPMPPGVYVPVSTKDPVSVSVYKEPAPPVQQQPVDQFLPVPGNIPASSGNEIQPPPKAYGNASEIKYKVKKGDALWKIARNYSITVDELYSYNNLKSTNILVGQTLLIPQGNSGALHKKSDALSHPKALKTNKTSSKKSSKSVNTPVLASVPADGIYIVKKNDSFTTIARKHKMKISEIAAANPGVDSSRLYVGQKINLKPGAGAAAVSSKKTSAAKAVKDVEPSSAENVKANDSLLDTIPSPEDTASTSPAASTDSKSPVSESGAASDFASAKKNDTVVISPDGDTVAPAEDTTVDALAVKYKVSASDLKARNSSLPADGKIKAGTVVKLP